MAWVSPSWRLMTVIANSLTYIVKWMLNKLPNITQGGEMSGGWI